MSNCLIANDVAESLPDYDLDRDEHDLQRYFIYKSIEKDGKKTLKGECRKCKKDLSRISGNTTTMVNHLKTCDGTAWALYKSGKKSLKTSLTPTTSRLVQPKINVVFAVSTN